MRLEFELWWLLAIPLLFALGWLSARIDLKNLLSESRALPRSYFRGLNFLLNDQPDRAVDAFIDVVRLSPETVELHFALGNLFRRRGETERAIRVHQNLLNRQDLPLRQQEQALFELGQDFLKAGLYDRAEEAFTKLQEGRYQAESLAGLLDIYQRSKEWHQAVDVAQRLRGDDSRLFDSQIAHFYCELAEEALQQQNYKGAEKFLNLARLENTHSVRAMILMGDVLTQQHQHDKAIAVWREIEATPEYLPLVAERLLIAHKALGQQSEGLNLLRAYLAQSKSEELFDLVFTATLAFDGAEAAEALAQTQLTKTASLSALDRLLEAEIAKLPALDAAVTSAQLPDNIAAASAAALDGELLQLIQTTLSKQRGRGARYLCSHCGFKAKRFYWQCPGCNDWDTYSPLRRTND